MSLLNLDFILALVFLLSINLILTTVWFWLATVTASFHSDCRLNFDVCCMAWSNRFRVWRSYDSANAILFSFFVHTLLVYYLEFTSTSSIHSRNQPLYHGLLLKNISDIFSRGSFASHSKYLQERHVRGRSAMLFIVNVSTITKVLHD